MEQFLALADAAWDVYDLEALGRVGDALEQAAAVAPRDPRVLWRQVRFSVAMGLTRDEPAEARAWFARGRAVAARCLDSDQGFVRRRMAAGWGSALALVDEARRPCMDQLAWSWTRWWFASDPVAVALDDDAVATLSAASAAPEGRWADGLVTGARAGGSPADGVDMLDGLGPSAHEDPAWIADRVELLVLAGREGAARGEADRLRTLPPSARRGAAEVRVKESLGIR